MACPKKRFTYRTIVCELTALCRYSYDKIHSRFSLKRSICDLYSLRQLIMQNFSLGSNDWKIKRRWCLPGLVDFLVALMYMLHEPKLTYLLWGYCGWLRCPVSRKSKVHNFWVTRSMDIGCLQVMNQYTQEWYQARRLLYILLTLGKV